MVIQHNIAALNAYRQLGANTSAVSKNLEKLSSGYKINRAGDDASGLAISEKMRAQISGLKVAQDNAQDGISLVQTAEGALTEVHSMLNRMVELAEKSSSGTVQDAVDRSSIQKETNDLISEIDRISESTNFNGIQLLDGSLSTTATATSAAGNGAKAATVSGVGVTFTNKVAVADVYGFDGVTTAGDTAGNLTFNVSYIDKDNVSKTKTLTAAITVESGDLQDADIVAAINADSDLSKLFTASINAVGDTTGVDDGIKITSKTTGTEGGKITGVTFGTLGTLAGTTSENATSIEGAGPSGSITLTAGAFGTTFGAGTKVTVGAKTYEITNDLSTVKDGNIGIQAGGASGSDAGTMAALVEALKANGVASAKIDATTNTVIDIADLTEIDTAQNGAAVTSDADGVAIRNTSAVAGVYTQAMVAGAGVANQTLTVSYIDEKGVKQTREVSYSATATDTTNGANIAEAINKDSTLSALFSVTSDSANNGNLTFTAKTAGTTGAQLISLDTTDTDFTASREIATEAKDAGKELELTSDLKAGDTVTVDGKKFEFVENVGDVTNGNIGVVMGADSKATAKNLASAMKSANVDMTYDPGSGKIFFEDNAASTTTKGGLTLLIGDSNESYQKVTVSIDNLSAKGLGVDKIDVSTREAAGNAIQTIKDAINKVSTNRGNLGGLQNRLEYTINNLSVTEENMTAAESNIRDVDMAEEMMAYTKNNVLTQAAQAMLAQANQAPQSVLQLLK